MGVTENHASAFDCVDFKETRSFERGGFALPMYPKVISSGCDVRIVWDGGKVEYWGEEKTSSQAETIAREMELELRASAFVKTSLLSFLNNIFEDLLQLGVPPHTARNAIHNGHLDILGAIVKWDKTTDVGSGEIGSLQKNL